MPSLCQNWSTGPLPDPEQRRCAGRFGWGPWRSPRERTGRVCIHLLEKNARDPRNHGLPSAAIPAGPVAPDFCRDLE
jgi:hypothetical protein